MTTNIKTIIVNTVISRSDTFTFSLRNRDVDAKIGDVVKFCLPSSGETFLTEVVEDYNNFNYGFRNITE